MLAHNGDYMRSNMADVTYMHLGSFPVFGEVHIAHRLSVLCFCGCVFYCLCFVCCVPNVASVSGHSILDSRFGLF